jgi:hypothetical protein
MGNKRDFGPILRGHEWAKMYPVAASQLIQFIGGSLVYADSSGHMTLALTATTTLFGWAVAPTSAQYGSTDSTNGYWTSSSTAGLSKILVYPFIANPGLVFKMHTILASTSTGLCVAARVGETADIVGVNDGTRQYAVPGTQSTDVLAFLALCEDGDTDAAYFTVNPGKMQLDAS